MSAGSAMSGNGAKVLSLLKQIAQTRTNAGGFESMLKLIKVTEGSEGRCVCELLVTEDLLNSVGTLHGGVTATLADSVSTWALMTTGKMVPGVSVDLSVSYMKAALPGKMIVIDAQTQRAGKTLAFLNIDIRDKITGTLLAQAKHTKFVGAIASEGPVRPRA